MSEINYSKIKQFVEHGIPDLEDPCDKCGGTGYYQELCPMCDGTGEEACGRRACYNCKGWGVIHLKCKCGQGNL